MSRSNVQLKTPKGTRDWVGDDLLLRENIFKTITDVFQRHGGTPLDTPAFELKDVLSEKYGEDSRLMYDLEDQGGEICSLRFDLTVPFARWLAMNGNVTHIKRYQIAKVYRRDQPAIARGRLREFHQCDFDIAGVYDPMVPDAEILFVIVEVFEALGLNIVIKTNHRRILDGLFAVAGVPDAKIRSISSAVDKLDKMPWEAVKKEMLEKGLPEEVADQVGEYVRRSGNIFDMLDELKSNEKLTANGDVSAGIADMALLASYLKAFGIEDTVSFDCSLARGLDYYSGLIFEVTTQGPSTPESRSKSPAIQVDSIAAGGRYDNLVGMYGKRPIPCVGISFGADRILTTLKPPTVKDSKNSSISRNLDVYVMAIGGKEFDGLLLERMAITRQLWKAGIRAEYMAKAKPKPLQQFKAAMGVPLAIILGQEELAAGQVRLKVFKPDVDEEKEPGQLVSRDNLVEEVKRLL
ncbi:histidyl-tRNA synthetase, mitochondrial precursor [Pochonia chlamydosporia 170]|uniref:histidine--tRNA ligase n=1 Tax=Pochonia chlamydosporia 170 TaxID=1380566 RepID=A0A179F5Z4_METCM|nr:histidyl-tRNA synthetase, mitochondrial precursor [Pochonia chlamydosporia 170]OAQ60780.1 histidyl-tRNA synthetase, mitochondrial precursor [Pochonia chlamydosporia 170]